MRIATSLKLFWFALSLLLLWLALLIVFHFNPQVDLWVSEAFFIRVPCPPGSAAGQVCGHFAYGKQTILEILRRVFFYLPSMSALVLVVILIGCLQHHGATYDAVKTRRLSLLLLSLALGPYVLVNLLFKGFSGRPRPYQTDIFAGTMPFEPAGSFMGQCAANCSFISGEAAGAGWLICLIILVPPQLRLKLIPSLLAASFVTPAMRLAFGGHYLSDVMLGWLSAPVVVSAVFAIAEIRRIGKKEREGTSLERDAPHRRRGRIGLLFGRRAGKGRGSRSQG